MEEKALKNSFTHGAILGPLVQFALPVLLALLLQTTYGAVDLLIVGQFSSPAEVSAVSTGSVTMQTITFVVTDIAIGLTVLLGTYIGQERREEAGEVVGAGLWMFAVLGAGMSVLCVLFAPLMAAAMQAPEEAFSATASYIAICSAGLIFITAYNLIGSVFRGIGDSVLPLITVAIACGINVAGDLILIAVFNMGAAGAAVATVAAQACSVVISFLIIRRKELPFSFSRSLIRRHSGHIRQVLSIGVPIAFQDILVSISFLAIMAVVNSLGVIASAGVGVAEKLCGFLMLVPSSYMQAMSAFTAQNIGAGKPERARKALWLSILTALGAGICLALVTFWYAPQMSALFVQDEEIIAASAEYLKAYAIDCMLTAFVFCLIGFFNGCGLTRFVMVQGILGAVGVRLPLSWVFSRIQPLSLFRIGLAIPISSTVQIVLCLTYYKRKANSIYGSDLR